MFAHFYAHNFHSLATRDVLSRVLSDPEFGLHRRLVALATLFAAEYAATVIWPFGHAGYRLKASVVTFADIFLTFGYLRSSSALHRISTELSETPISGGLFVSHFCAMAIYEAISWAYGEHVVGLLSGYAVAMRLISGGSAVLLAAFAFVPFGLWLKLIRETGWLWLYALAASAAAFTAVDYLQPIWSVGILQQATFHLVRTSLIPFLPTIVADPAARMLGTPRFSVEITAACSGFEGMGLMLAFAAVWLWLFRRECRFPQALILIPAGAMAAFLLNAVRIAVLILIGNAGAPAIAMGGFHSAAGWCLFCGAALGLSVCANRIRWLTNTEPEPTKIIAESENPTAVYLLPFCSILIVGMLTALARSDFDWLYPVRFFATAGVLWVLRKRYCALDWKFGWSGPAIGVLTFLLWIGVDQFVTAGHNNGIPDALANSSPLARTAWIAVRMVAAVSTVPIAEELAFRGFLMRRIISSDFESVPLNEFTWLSLGVSSILFGLLHGKLWFAGVVAGLLYSWAMVRRGRFGDAVIAHATTNALLAAYVLIFHRWHFWQ